MITPFKAFRKWPAIIALALWVIVCPSQSQDGVSYPFGSRKEPYVAGIKPTVVSQEYQDTLIRNSYNIWKSKLKAQCGGYIVAFDKDHAAVSEGMGYGMLITVLMAGYDWQARYFFDGLFRVARNNPAYRMDPALMDWRLNWDCSSAGNGYNAMDGDLDIAMALLMADKQWGSWGAINYKQEGIKTIAAIKNKNMSPNGYTRGLPNPDHSRTSDYMVTHFKAFGRATGDIFWDYATNRAFQLLDTLQNRYSPSTGLIPDFVVDIPYNPMPSTGYRADNNENEGFYYWNACRLPLRLASDYVTTGDERSKVITSKLVSFVQQASNYDPDKIAAGYRLDGSPIVNKAFPSFVGPITAGAIVDASFQPFLNKLWSFSGSNLAWDYYNNELQFLSLIVASGNWWNP